MANRKTFESSLEELEKIVKELESGNLSLEDAVKQFEKGMDCSRFCRKKLDETEKKITMLINNSSQSGELEEINFGNE